MESRYERIMINQSFLLFFVDISCVLGAFTQLAFVGEELGAAVGEGQGLVHAVGVLGLEHGRAAAVKGLQGGFTARI